jgi:pimeloyl-ACP methyl ester carboxylesterase
MSSGISKYVTVLNRELHYTEWGPPDASRGHVVCCHGLLRTCRDFDILAAALADAAYHVVCVDVVGRGLSQWSPEPAEEYNCGFYAKLAAALLDALSMDRVAWVGTSMGGIIGYYAAATTLAHGGRITKLLLNDIGPVVNPVAIERIFSYCRTPIVCDRFTELEAILSAAYKPFGIECPVLMRRLIESGVRRTPEGKYTPHYDPRVVDCLAVGSGGTGVAGVDPWDLYDKVACPTIVLRGVNSDLLLPATVEEMATRGPKARCVTINGCGHAPALHTPPQIAVVLSFLLGDEPR